MNPEMTNDSNLQAEAVAVEPKPQNHFSRIFGVLFSPGETFKEIGLAPRILIPFILLAVLAGAVNFAVTNRIGYDNIVRKQMESMVNAGWIPADQAEEQIKQATTGTRGTIGKIQGPVFGAIGFLVGMLVIAGIFKLFTMMMGSSNNFKPVLSVVCYAYLAIALIQMTVTVISVYLKNPEDIDLYNPVSSNLGAILTMSGAGLSKFVTSLASWIDVFGIWRIVLLAIGCAAVTPKMKPGTAAIPHIILYCLGALIFSAMAGMFG